MKYIIIITSMMFFSIKSQGQQLLKIGDVFPKIEVTTLEDKKITLPDYCQGKITLLAIGFSMKAQDPINTWTDYVLKEYSVWNYYEVPIGSELYIPFAKSIDNSMKNFVPPNLHSKTATYYGLKCKTYKQLFDVKDDDTCYIFLLDSAGIIQFKLIGPITDSARIAISKIIPTLK